MFELSNLHFTPSPNQSIQSMNSQLKQTSSSGLGGEVLLWFSIKLFFKYKLFNPKLLFQVEKQYIIPINNYH
jgi:hypothetical protein